MKTNVYRPFIALIILALSCAPVFPQTDDNAKKQAEAKRELRRKTLVLLDEIATGAHGLKLLENRVYILGETAALFWDHDEKRARNLFWDAYTTIGILTQTDSRQAAVSTNKSNERAMTVFTLRRQLLHKAAKRNYQLALDLLNSAHPVSPELQRHAQYLPNVEQEIAAAATVKDPELAYKLARESLGKELNYSILEQLMNLHDLKPELAVKLAGEIIDKIQSVDLSVDFKASGIAVQLLAMSRPAAAVAHDEPYQGEANPLNLTREQRRALVETILNGALGVSKNATLLSGLSELTPEIQEFAPERVALAQKRVAAFLQTLNKEQRGWQQYSSIVRTRSPEQILSSAQKVENEHQRRNLQQQAIVLAVLRNRAGSFRDYIENEIKDDGTRQTLIDALFTEQISAASMRADVDELRELIPKVRLKEERARTMAAMAVLLEKKGEHEEALKLLRDAHGLVKLDFNSETHTHALLTLIAAYSVVEPDKAFAIIETVIDSANNQISKALLLDKIVSSGVVRKGEIILQNSGIQIDMILTQYGKALAALAHTDFDRTKAAADRIERNELRLLARLTLAQTLLSPEPHMGNRRRID